MVREKNRLSPEELAKRYDPNKFPFQTTAEIDRLEAEMIGQERAVKAMDFGLNVKQEGYRTERLYPLLIFAAKSI